MYPNFISYITCWLHGNYHLILHFKIQAEGAAPSMKREMVESLIGT